MTEERFEELINLYLDNEIGRKELRELKHAIRDNLVLRRKFERSCQLHQAARKALSEKEAEAGPGRSSSGLGGRWLGRHSSSSRSSSSGRSSRSSGSSSSGHSGGSGTASSTIRIKSSDTRRSRSSGEDGEDLIEEPVPFFSSAFGMMLGGLVLTLILTALVYVFGFSAGSDPTFEGPGQEMGAVDRRLDDAEIAAHLRESVGTPGESKPSAEEMLLAKFYASSLAGNSVTRSMQANFFTTRINTIMEVSTDGNASVWHLHASESSYIAPSQFALGDMPGGQPGINWPTVPTGEVSVPNSWNAATVPGNLGVPKMP